MPYEILDGPRIWFAESLSDPLDLEGGQIVRITVGAEWDAANLSFQVSSDGVKFFDAWQWDKEIILPCARRRGIVYVPNWPGVTHVKFRSGSAKFPVPQEDPYGPIGAEFGVAIFKP